MSDTVIVKGERLVLHLISGECYTGTVDCVCQNSIELYNVTTKNNVEIGNNLTFYRPEIAQILKATDTKDNDLDSGASCGGSEIDDAPAIKMAPGEFSRLQAMINEYIYILHKDQDCEAALGRLRSVESVGVAALGKPYSLFVMCTWAEVFIFDLTVLGFDELKPILESEDICKVLHGGTELYRCLRRNYGVEMKNIFDTQIADSYLATKRGFADDARNLAECTNFNLNFPLGLLDPAMEHCVRDDFWNTRPILKVAKTMAAQMVAYLITLRDYFTKLMLKDVTDAVESMYTKVKNTDNLTMIQEKTKLVNLSN